MQPRPAIARSATLVVVVLVAVLATACEAPSPDDGPVIVTTDERVLEVRAAREALAAPVPTVVAEAERLVAALERVWIEEAEADQRAALAETLQTGPFRDAVEALGAVELEGDGPDVTAASALVEEMVTDGRALLAVADEELASIVAPPPFDAELEGLLAGWDARGSYTQQLTAFEEMAVAADELAAEADARSSVPICVGLWPRRRDAASTVAERTRELRDLIRDRRGQQFDELRDEYRQDPYGTGDLLGVLDARAAAACWSTGSDAPDIVAGLEELVGELGAALNPADLQG